MKKGKSMGMDEKAMNLGLAAVGGAASGLVVWGIKKIPGADKINENLPEIANAAGAFFLLDVKGMEPAAYGMMGGAGRQVAKNFGIGDVNEDDLSGVFDDYAETIKGLDNALNGSDDDQ